MAVMLSLVAAFLASSLESSSADELQPVETKTSAPIPFDEIGAKATADYSGDAIGIRTTSEGVKLHTDFQKVSGTVTRQGLLLDSTDEQQGRFQLMEECVLKTLKTARK
jgi:hypothetical protein